MPDNEIASENEELQTPTPDPGAQDSAETPSDVQPAAADGTSENDQIVEPKMADTTEASQNAESAPEQSSPTAEELAMLAQMDGVDDGLNKVSSVEFEQFSKSSNAASPHNINMLLDVTMPVAIELGRTTMPIQDILNLGPGSVVELNKLAGEPVDLLVNEKLIARGEVVVVDENFGIRITSMISQEDRIKSLG